MSDLADKLINRYGLNALQGIIASINDRDGTINYSCPADPKDLRNTGYCLTPEDFKLLPNVGEGMKMMSGIGISHHIFTQQKCIAKGLIDEADLNNIHQYMRTLLLEYGVEIGTIAVCPHEEKLDENGRKFFSCDCGKPKPGLIKQILNKNPNLKPNQILVIGDSNRDIPAKEFMDDGMMFVAVPSPEATKNIEGKLGKNEWEKIIDHNGKNCICADDMLEIAITLKKLKK